MVAKFLYRKADGRFLGGGFFDVQPPLVNDAPDWDNYGVAEFGDADQPDPSRHVYDAEHGKREMTVQEREALKAEQETADITAESRKVDVLTTIAWTIRFRNPTNWNAMSGAEKRAAVLAEAGHWRDIRAVIAKLVG